MQPLNIITITMQMELTTFYIVMFYILQRFSFLGFWIIFVVDEMLSMALQFSPRRTRSVHQQIMIQLCSHCESLSLILSMTLQYSVLAEHVLYINYYDTAVYPLWKPIVLQCCSKLVLYSTLTSTCFPSNKRGVLLYQLYYIAEWD